MTTILYQKVGQDAARRCDATCHEATASTCVCLCGGRYHGKGHDHAQALLTSDIIEGRLGPVLQKAVAEAGIGWRQPALFEAAS